ncbi:MAG TPA: DUF4040 domain-containing protein [Tenuifilaceae bacterium]|nr:DUF4040 domain-containing protein [Tenuifilaceae bacterium]
MSILLAVFLGVVVIILAILAIYHSNLKVAIIATGVVGLFSSIIYLLLSAPDVAMTEASIGSGLTTIIFFYVLNKIRKSNG